MRKIAKILSVALALTMIFAVCVMPASAEDAVNTYDEHVTARVVATPDGKNSSDLQIYKIEVYFDSTNSFQNLHMFLSWDNSAFQLLRATNKADLPNMALANANMVIDKTDPDSPFYEGTAYTENEGFYMGEGVFADEGVALFPNDAAQPALSKISDGALGATLLGEGYTGLYWNWEAPFDQNALLLSGGDHNGFEPHPLAGEQKILTFYLREKADAKPGTYTIGMNERQVSRLEGTYTWADDVDSKSIGFGAFSSFNTKADYYQDSWYNITNAQVQIGESTSSIINSYKNQIRFQKNETAYANAFDVRTLAKISKADFEATFGDEDTALSKIQKIGFVYANTDAEGEFKMEDVKAYLESGTALDTNYYKDVPVNTISTAFAKNGDGADYVISCLIKNIPDADQTKGVKAVAYIVYEGDSGAEVALYPDVTTTNFQELYNQYYTQAFPG